MCKYCEGNVGDRPELLNIDGYQVYIDGKGRLANDDECVETQINYCPICGRQLP